MLGDDPRRFQELPLALGLVYLAVALAGDRPGEHWATAATLIGFGLAVLAVREGWVDWGSAPAHLIGFEPGHSSRQVWSGAASTRRSAGLRSPRWPPG